MFKTRCRCGVNVINFRNKIGDFYVGTCCRLAGFDDLGNRPTQEASKEEVSVETPKKEKKSKKAE